MHRVLAPNGRPVSTRHAFHRANYYHKTQKTHPATTAMGGRRPLLTWTHKALAPAATYTDARRFVRMQHQVTWCASLAAIDTTHASQRVTGRDPPREAVSRGVGPWTWRQTAVERLGLALLVPHQRKQDRALLVALPPRSIQHESAGAHARCSTPSRAPAPRPVGCPAPEFPP
jgi:hypothetical protein